MSDTPAGIIFVEVPDEYQGTIGDVQIDPKIRLPLVADEGTSPQASDISWEAILAGMLRLLATEAEHPDADYYRAFVRGARPQIIEELAETGIIAAKNGEFDRAEEIFTALTGLAPERFEGPSNLAAALAQRAERAERHGNAEAASADRQRAAELYGELLAREEAPVELLFNSGMFSLSVHDYRRARDRLQAFVTHVGDDDDDAEEDEDDEHAHIEQLIEARRLLKHLEQHNMLDSMFQEAYDYIRMGEEARGIERVSAFLERSPDTWNAWFLLGWAHRRLGDFDEAATAFERAVECGGGNADTLNELAICRLEQGRLDESRTALEEALTRDPDNTKIISNFGVWALRSDLPDEARKFFETVQALDPDDPISVRFLEEIEQMGY